jgi:hypothetical protein
MPRKQRLSRLQRDVVSQLEEAGAEELTVVMNALSDEGAFYPRRAEVIAELELAIRGLVERGLVALVWYDAPGYPEVGLAAREVLQLPGWLAWKEAGGYWHVPTPFANGVVGLALRRTS